MVDWNLAVTVFVSGVSVVMLVMFIMQMTIKASSFIVRLYEKSVAKAGN